jgi:hypothetical protein
MPFLVVPRFLWFHITEEALSNSNNTRHNYATPAELMLSRGEEAGMKSKYET